MVKGVNKSIIEINDTGSKFFNKAILFVSPEFVDSSGKRMGNEAARFVKKLTLGENGATLRMTVRKERRNRRIALCVMGLVVAAALVLFYFM